MRRPLATCALSLFTALWAPAALAIVYVPGSVENGVYTHPRFVEPGEEAERPAVLQTRSSGLRIEKDPGAAEAEATSEPAAPEVETH